MAAVPRFDSPSVAVAPATLLPRYADVRRPAVARCLALPRLPALIPVEADPTEGRAFAVPAMAARELAAAWLIVFAIALAGTALF